MNMTVHTALPGAQLAAAAARGLRLAAEGQQPQPGAAPEAQPVPAAPKPRSFAQLDARRIYDRLNARAPRAAAFGQAPMPRPSSPPARQGRPAGRLDPNAIYRRINETNIWKKG